MLGTDAIAGLLCCVVVGVVASSLLLLKAEVGLPPPPLEVETYVGGGDPPPTEDSHVSGSAVSGVCIPAESSAADSCITPGMGGGGGEGELEQAPRMGTRSPAVAKSSLVGVTASWTRKREFGEPPLDIVSDIITHFK